MRAKNHDQRKGQWLINKIRFADDFPKPKNNLTLEESIAFEKAVVEIRLWNMENNEFDKLMVDYNG